jgi:ABC-type multidrug transport system fused ATPase/permease subunit
MQKKRIDLLTHRLQAITMVTERLKLIDQRFFWYRLTSFLGAWVLAILTRFVIPGMTWLWVFLGMVLVFLVVVSFHRKLDEQRLRYQNAQDWLTQQIARATLDWSNLPELHNINPDSEHPFMNDLNLVGEHSLLQLIDSTATIGGQKRLKTWFLNPDLQIVAINQRQTLVSELLKLTGFRTQLMLSGWQIKQDAKGLWDDRGIYQWLQTHTPEGSLKRLLILLSTLAGLNYVLLGLDLLAGWPAYWQFSFILYIGIYFFQYRAYQSTFQDAYQLSKDLQPLDFILKFLESYPAKQDSHLAGLLGTLKKPGQKPSEYLRKIVMISSAASIQNNQILSLLINALLPWDIFFAYILAGFKHKLIGHLPTWLNVWYKAEALTALANFAYLNPEYQFPVIQKDSSQPIYKAVNLGHPLITRDEKVVNDFSFSEVGEVALISGSNMSGKSTFLRTLGINLTLAYAGTVVNASEMVVPLMRLFTVIQVSDSLKDGFSYFYAEVRRLKELLVRLEDTSSLPVYYLIDEIFQGTNHEERRIGSLAYLKALVNANGVGAISTHDIELSKLAEVELRIHNYNFQDSVVDGKMSFDYRLRPGPSPTTNALKIMAIEGLPVNNDFQRIM